MGGQRHQFLKAKTLGVLSALSVTGAISFMIYRTEGAQSPYFAGVNLPTLCFAAMMPWSLVQTLLMCGGTLLFYVVACVLNPSAHSPSFLPYLGFNTSFIFIASTVCVDSRSFCPACASRIFACGISSTPRIANFRTSTASRPSFSRTSATSCARRSRSFSAPWKRCSPEGTRSRRRFTTASCSCIGILRLLKLINDLLELTRIDLRREDIRKKTMKLGPYVKGIVDSVRHLGLSKQLRIKVEEGDPKAEALIDPSRIEKVLLNLLTNALKYTPAGGSITVRWRSDVAGSEIDVADTGVGIPAEDLSKVFDRFHQVRSNEANQNQGVGIGLALAKELVEQHGGRIEVESEPGKGSLFRILLPNVEASAAPAMESPAPVEPQTSEEAKEAVAEPLVAARRRRSRSSTPSARRIAVGGKSARETDLPTLGRGEETILVADDESDMRRYIVSLLSESYRVVQTASGANVADLVAEHEPRIVLLDWMMPGKDGLAVCASCAGITRDMKIVLLTARIDESSKLDALDAGVDDFLTKPFSSIELRTRVANLLRSARLQTELRAPITTSRTPSRNCSAPRPCSSRARR